MPELEAELALHSDRTKSYRTVFLIILIVLTGWGFLLNSKVSKLEQSLIDTQSVLEHVIKDLEHVSSVANSADYLAINANRYAHSHNSYSDVQLKKNIVQINHAVASVSELQGVSFYWKHLEFPDLSLGQNRKLGLIAQNVESVFPELVTTDSAGIKSVDYIQIIPVLVEAIKEQQSQIDQLQSEVDQLSR